MELQVYYADSLFKTHDALKYFRSGVYDMGLDWAAYHPDETPDLVYPSDFPVPMNAELFKKWLQAPKDSYSGIVEPLYKKYGLKVLSYHAQIGTWYMVSQKPIKKLDDMRGLMGRRIGFGTRDTLFRAMGVATVQLSVSEQYEALQRGTVDILPTTLESVSGAKLYEVAKYLLGPPGHSVAAYVMRIPAFEALPKDLQKVLTDSFLEAQERWLDEYMVLIADLKSKLEEQGVVFNTLSEADLRKVDEIEKEYTETFVKRYPWASKFREASEKYRLK